MTVDKDMKADTEISCLRIASVQIDYQPSYYLRSGVSPLCEPLISQPLSTENNHHNYLDDIKKHKPLKEVCELLIKSAKSKYLETYIKKLEDILKYCFDNKVNLLVFPEYSIPVEAVETLMRFSTHMTIVAGIGHLGKKDIGHLSDLDIPVENISIANNAGLVLSPSKNFLVSKKHSAQGENKIEEGNGPETHRLQFGKNTFLKVSISICLDYLREFTSISDSSPDIVIASALSKNTKEFTDKTSRDFITVFSNHFLYGGTCILSPQVEGEILTNINGTMPLDKSLEAIVILDWDFNRRKMTVPSNLGNVKHPVFAVSPIIHAGKEEEISKGINIINSLMQVDNKNLDRDSISTCAQDLLELMESQGIKNQIIKQCFENLSDRDRIDSMTAEGIRSLTRHCILREDILTITEWRYQQLNEVIFQFKKINQDDKEDEYNIVNPLNIYKKKAAEIHSDVRLELKSTRSKSIRQASSNKEIQSILVATLGNYTTSSALKSLPKQLTMLKTIALSRDPNIVLSYRFRTEEDDLGFMNPHFDIICTTHDRSEDEVEELRDGLGQLIHVTFTGAYSIGYSFKDKAYEEFFQKIQNLNAHTVEIEIETSEVNQLSSNPPDWGTINDLLRSLREPVLIELQCSKSLSSDQPEISLVSKNETRKETVNKSKSSKNIKHVLNEILLNEVNDIRNLQLRIFVGSPKVIPDSVLDMIGIEMAGGNKFNIITDYSEQSQKIFLKSPAEILKTFHTPVGSNYPTSGGNKNKLNKVTNETQFPAGGIVLGKANIRKIQSDEEIEVKIAPEDRLKHTYIVGRTGSGKTNLLKLMASQDVEVPGRGVTIVDPHGDLVDHVLKAIPNSREKEVILIDLSRQDVVPVLNPLDLDINDSIVRDRTISELIILLKSRVYHEHTGPIFEDVVRAVFETMLDPGYPIPASFTEIPNFLMDKNLQKRIINLLEDRSLIQRWKFEPSLARSDDHASKIHYVISKFTDIARDETLKCVFGGAKSTVDIDKIVNSGGILLVKIPEAIIGKSSADFIGSLILLKLRMAIIRRRQSFQTQNTLQPHHHFVYVDEFQNFVNTDFNVIVAEARKFNVGFTLAHQNLEQLRGFDRNTGMRNDQLINSIIGNVGNLVIFSHGVYDAEVFSKQLGISAEDLMRIGKHEAVAKILIDNDDTTPFTLKPDFSPEVINPRRIEEIEASMIATGVWQDRKTLLADINKRIDNLNDAITQKEEAVKQKEEIAKQKEKDELREQAYLASKPHLMDLDKMLIQHEISMWVELFLMDENTKINRSLGKTKVLIENLTRGILGIELSQVPVKKKGEIIQEILETFNNRIMKYARRKSPENYYPRLQEIYENKDASVFDAEDISLFFKDAYHEFLQEIRESWISNLNDNENHVEI